MVYTRLRAGVCLLHDTVAVCTYTYTHTHSMAKSYGSFLVTMVTAVRPAGFIMSYSHL